MADVTLSAAARNNLVSLQETSKLTKQTQARLATGLKVGSAVDDPVAYFQSKALADRASDFGIKKGYIDQGVSTLQASVQGLDSIEVVIKQMRGITSAARTSTTKVEIDNVIEQFNDLRKQIGSLAKDASYQGLNLINGTGQTLEVSFSNYSSAQLTVKSLDATARGLDISRLEDLPTRSSIPTPTDILGSPVAFDYQGDNVDRVISSVAPNNTLTFTMAMTGTQMVLNTTGSISFSYGTYTVQLTVGSDGTYPRGETLTAGQVITLTIGSSTGASSPGTVYVSDVSSAGSIGMTMKAFDGRTTLGVGMGESFRSIDKQLVAAITSVQSTANIIGSNITLLQTRLDFTTNYVNTLTIGAGKLNLADLNEESANALALQTRQQLGIQSLSMATQAEQSVVGLFQ